MPRQVAIHVKTENFIWPPQALFIKRFRKGTKFLTLSWAKISQATAIVDSEKMKFLRFNPASENTLAYKFKQSRLSPPSTAKSQINWNARNVPKCKLISRGPILLPHKYNLDVLISYDRFRKSHSR